MTDARLPTSLWVEAHVRQCSTEGVPVYVARRGDGSSGTVLLKLNQLEQGCRVLTQMRDMEGRLGWLSALGKDLVAEEDADAYLARAAARDPDLWVVEIEDREGRHFLTEKVRS